MLATETITSAADVALPDGPPSSAPDELRAFVRTERLARPHGVRTLVHIGVVLGAWIGLAAVGFAADRFLVWLPIWALLAMLTATPIALMHEAVHQNLFRSRNANHVAGTIAAAWMFFHGPAYRAWHLTHHAYTFSPDDSEQLPDRFRSRPGYLGYCAVLGPAFAVILWAGALGTLVGRPPRWVGPERLRRYVRRWALAPVVVFALAGAAATMWPAVLLKGWLVPALVGSIVVFPFLTMPEHYEGKSSPTLLGNTRTTVSNRVQRYLYWNNNLHTAHHLIPTVPPHALHRVDARIAEANTLRERGFLAFHRRVLASLPWRASAADEPVDAQPVAGVPAEITTNLPVDAPRPEGSGGSGVTITISNRVDAEWLPRLWQIYVAAFEPLTERALLNHLYPREMFDELVLDDRIWKIVGWNNGVPVGLAATTNELELVPQISPPYLARRYPEYAARKAIYFSIFVCVDAEARSNTLSGRLMAGMAQVAAHQDGLQICDVSQYNCDIGVDRMIHRVVDWFPESAFERIDSQHYFTCVLPKPLENLPFSKQPMPVPVLDLRDRSAPAPADGPAQSVPTTER